MRVILTENVGVGVKEGATAGAGSWWELLAGVLLAGICSEVVEESVELTMWSSEADAAFKVCPTCNDFQAPVLSSKRRNPLRPCEMPKTD